MVLVYNNKIDLIAVKDPSPRRKYFIVSEQALSVVLISLIFTFTESETQSQSQAESLSGFTFMRHFTFLMFVKSKRSLVIFLTCLGSIAVTFNNFNIVKIVDPVVTFANIFRNNSQYMEI